MKNTISIALITIALLMLTMAPAAAQDSVIGGGEIFDNAWECANPIYSLQIQGKIGLYRDWDDWYVLQGQQSSKPTITFTYNYAECDIALALEVYSGDYEVSEDGDRIYSLEDDDWVGSLEASDSPESVTFDIPGTCFIHVYVTDYWAKVGGSYQIDIEPYSNISERIDDNFSEEPVPEMILPPPGIDAYNSEDTPLFLGGGGGDAPQPVDPCQGPDEIEPNNDENTKTATAALQIKGHACLNDIDWYVLQGQAGVNPTITLTYNSDECDVDLDVYSVDGYVGSLTEPTSPDQAAFSLPGECYIVVNCFSGEGDYTIDIAP